jgi:hypothetical protein
MELASMKDATDMRQNGQIDCNESAAILTL